MRLPARRFHQLFGSYAPWPLQQGEDRVGLAALAGASGLLRGFGRFLGWVAFLADLPFFFATCAPCGATRAFLVAFGFSPVAVAWAVPVSSAIDVFMFSLSAVITAVTTWITPVRRESKSILPETAKGDGRAIAAPGSWQQMASDGRAWGKIWAQTGGRHRRVADPAQR
jgi:hypothetical protein